MDNTNRDLMRLPNGVLIKIPHDVFIKNVLFSNDVGVVRCPNDYKLSNDDFKKTRIFDNSPK